MAEVRQGEPWNEGLMSGWAGRTAHARARVEVESSDGMTITTWGDALSGESSARLRWRRADRIPVSHPCNSDVVLSGTLPRAGRPPFERCLDALLW